MRRQLGMFYEEAIAFGGELREPILGELQLILQLANVAFAFEKQVGGGGKADKTADRNGRTERANRDEELRVLRRSAGCRETLQRCRLVRKHEGLDAILEIDG